MIRYDNLYRYNTSGKLLVWYLEREVAKYRTVSGQLAGNKTTSAWTECKGKNVGKKNETSPEDQAHKECLAKYENKLTKGGYVDDVDKVSNPTYIKPMLAETYYSEVNNPETNDSKIKNNIPSIKLFQEGVIMQPKLDGVKCLATVDGLFSRKGQRIIGTPHIEKCLEKFFIENPEIILDGELYNHTLEFNVLNGTIRRDPSNDTEEEKEVRNSIEYFVYDIASSNDIYLERAVQLNNFFGKGVDSYIKNLTNLNIRVNTETQVNEIHNVLVGQGFEGGILRTLNGLYKQGKRSKDLLKVKQFTDEEFTIVDIIEGDGNNAGMAAKIKIEDKGVIIYPNMVGSWDFCRKVLKEKEEYIGGQATVKFFGRTPDGSLRHPSVKALYKNKRDF